MKREPRTLTLQKLIFSFSHNFTFLQMFFFFSPFLPEGIAPVVLNQSRTGIPIGDSEDMKDVTRNWIESDILTTLDSCGSRCYMKSDNYNTGPITYTGNGSCSLVSPSIFCWTFFGHVSAH